MRRQYSRRVIEETLLCFVHYNMFRFLDMNFQSSKFKLKKFVNSWEREINSTSYSMPPKSCVTHSQLDKHIWWWPIKFFFGGCVTPLSMELGNISEISTPGLNLVGKYSSEL